MCLCSINEIGILTKRVDVSSPLPQSVTPAVIKPAAIPPRRIRQKKGPKRLKKRKTAEDLDREMDDYRAAAPT